MDTQVHGETVQSDLYELSGGGSFKQRRTWDGDVSPELSHWRRRKKTDWKAQIPFLDKLRWTDCQGFEPNEPTLERAAKALETQRNLLEVPHRMLVDPLVLQIPELQCIARDLRWLAPFWKRCGPLASKWSNSSQIAKCFVSSNIGSCESSRLWKIEVSKFSKGKIPVNSSDLQKFPSKRMKMLH